MTLSDLPQKTCVIGLSYFDVSGELLKQSQLCGCVVAADKEQGIDIKLQHTAATDDAAVFTLPPSLDAWFIAPAGHYKNAESGVDMLNPDYLVTWDIHKTRQDKADGEHEWWNWLPRTQAPQVG